MATAIGSYVTTATLKARLLPAGVTDTTDDTLLGTICDQVNQWIETFTGAVLAPVASAVYLFDGDGGNTIYVPNGVRTVSLLEVGDSTGDSFSTIASTDYFLRPLAQDRPPHMPAWKIVLSDLPAGSYRTFPRGYANVRVTMVTGPAAIPDDVIDVALTVATRVWARRQSGQADMIGVDETGAPTISREVSARDRATLSKYRVNVMAY